MLLTAKAAASDRIAGLRRGADDYLTKPFHRELVTGCHHGRGLIAFIREEKSVDKQANYGVM